MNRKLDAIARILAPHKHDPVALASVARGLLDGEPMGDDLLFVIVALGLLALWTSVSNGALPDGSIPLPPGPGNPLPPSGPGNPPPPPSGNNSGAGTPPPIVSTDGDMIDPGSCQIVNAPDFRGWSIVSRITRVELTPDNCKIFTDPDVEGWPDTFPPGFADPIGFTVWAFVFVGGQWVCSGFLEGVGHYKSADGVGDSVFDFVNNWWYSGRWAPMTGHAIQPGETIGLMLCGGDQRDGKGPDTGIRTQIVAFQAAENAAYTF